ncbi:hypothetical protein KUTeg_024323 [Tegillarca granosa]|uniref:Uncharacterized protein n=1 Tax=Tegillarca granosa TaxID=220873 RepID=A0ABQ9E2J0_TEGGR|nr:hypothetical protein KUTeg_024323 [Tegillarca granosa]
MEFPELGKNCHESSCKQLAETIYTTIHMDVQSLLERYTQTSVLLKGVKQKRAAALFRTAGPSKTTTQNKPKNTPKPQNTTMSQIGRDFNRQRQERQAQSQPVQNIQAGLSEDEALAQAIQMSLSESQQPSWHNQNSSVPK